MEFTVRSDSFKDGDYLTKDHILSADYGFGCEGGNKSPHLAWSGAPTGTKSFAYALTYQADDRTLTDKEVDKAHKKIQDRLKHVLKAKIRGEE